MTGRLRLESSLDGCRRIRLAASGESPARAPIRFVDRYRIFREA